MELSFASPSSIVASPSLVPATTRFNRLLLNCFLKKTHIFWNTLITNSLSFININENRTSERVRDRDFATERGRRQNYREWETEGGGLIKWQVWAGLTLLDLQPVDRWGSPAWLLPQQGSKARQINWRNNNVILRKIFPITWFQNKNNWCNKKRNNRFNFKHSYMLQVWLFKTWVRNECGDEGHIKIMSMFGMTLFLRAALAATMLSTSGSWTPSTAIRLQVTPIQNQINIL